MVTDRVAGERLVSFPGVGDLDAAPVLLVAMALVAALVVALIWHSRRSLPVATRAFRALRTAAARRDPAIGAATGPIALARWLERNAPAAHAAGGGLIELYLRESWSGERLTRRQSITVRRDLRQVRRLLRHRKREDGPRVDP
jgi:hypothetical protein